ncbi:MAG: hypothetical protein MZV65_43125 [Chromatiales bacterium]|nr:hypothetical protein [Chromatiales bacterium]
MTDHLALWHPSPARPNPEPDSTLEPGALHLWRIDTSEGGADPDGCRTRLNEAQLARVTALRHDAHRARYTRALAGLNRVLAAYLDRAT